jgi:hypothetical protein
MGSHLGSGLRFEIRFGLHLAVNIVLANLCFAIKEAFLQLFNTLYTASLSHLKVARLNFF